MLRTIFHPLFLFPALILLLVMGLTALTEYRVEEYGQSIAFVLNDKIPQINSKLQSSLLETRQNLDLYISNLHTPEQLNATKKVFASVLENTSSLEKYFQDNPGELEEHINGTIRIPKLIRDLQETSDAINKISPGDVAAETEARRTLNKFVRDVIDFSAETIHLHTAETQSLLEKIKQKDSQRLLLLILTWMASLSLVVFLFCNAVSCRRRSEMALKAEQSNSMFATALQSARVGIMIRDLLQKDFPVVFINNAFTDITGYEEKDVKNKPPFFLFGIHTSQESARMMWQAFLERTHIAKTLLLYRKDNSPFWGEWNTSPVINRDGVPSHFISFIIDISSIRATQEALQLAKEEAEKAVSVKGHFLAAMSHELRTPINGMLGVLDLLADITTNEEQIKLVDIAKVSGKRLLEIVNDILDYSKIEAGKFEVELAPFSLRQMIKEAVDLVEPMAAAKKLPLKCLIAEDTPDFLESDGGRIRQVLLNLISNAIKFTEHGFIELKVFCLLDNSNSNHGAALIRFEVIDTGLGIGVADQEKLFNEFMQVERSFTRRFEGTGLGLAISKQLIKLLGGEIGVESRIGQGSKFWFMLPLKTANPLALQATTEEKPVSFKELPSKFVARVLLAEDNPVNQMVANRYLQKAGCTVDVANNGLEAVEKFRNSEYDLIFMDVSMPEMDGLEATRQIRSLEGNVSKTPVIALTAHAMRGDREQCIASGMNDYLSKPLSFGTMINALEKWLPKATQQERGNIQVEEATIEAPSQGDGPMVFDQKVIGRLVKDLGAETTLHIAQVFFEDMEKRFNKLKETITQENCWAVSEAAHALKSSSANCGLMRFSDLMKQMEVAGKNGEIELIKKLAETLDSDYVLAREALSTGIEKYKK